MNIATAFKAALQSLPISISTTGFAVLVTSIYSATVLYGEYWTWLAALFLWAELTTATVVYMLLVHRAKVDDRIERIGDLIRFDSLTGAFTRSHFLDRVRRHGDSGCLMIVDIDHFKAINDSHGHDAGDQALVLMAKLLQDAVGELGLVGRLGGEEFGIFLPRVTGEEGRALGEGLIALARTAGDNGEDAPWLYPDISIGATIREEHEPLGHTLKRADRAFYAAKNQGRCRLSFSYPSSPITALAGQAG